MAKNKNLNSNLPGQMVIWDLNFNKTVSKPLLINAVEVKTPLFSLKVENIINKYKEIKKVSRIIRYKAGSIGVEMQEENSYVTHYLNREGEEEFSFLKKSPVLPWDSIIYFNKNHEKLQFNKTQLDLIQKLMIKDREKIKRIIHRKGDENVLIEYSDKVKDILPNGWSLDFLSINKIECNKDEIYLIPEGIGEKDTSSIEQIQDKVKLGDFVEAYYGKDIIQGKIIHIYGLENKILNIIFDNGSRHTAIGRSAVRKILKSA